MVDWNPFSDDAWDEVESWGKPKSKGETPVAPASATAPEPKKKPFPEIASKKSGVKRILIVDDNLMIRRNHKLFLERLGFEVLEAVDGRNALAKIEHYGPDSFSLVILDLNMPVMSGEDFVAQAMAKFDSALPPVWVCTVDGDAATVRNLLAKGISGYLLKPVQLRAFATKLQGLFPDMELRIP